MTTRIYEDNGGMVVFEATDDIHVHYQRPLPDRPQTRPVVTIEELDPEEIDPDEPGKVLIRWEDLDQLIEALQGIKASL